MENELIELQKRADQSREYHEEALRARRLAEFKYATAHDIRKKAITDAQNAEQEFNDAKNKEKKACELADLAFQRLASFQFKTTGEIKTS